MCMVKRSFHLKPSHYAIGFHVLILCIILVLFYAVLGPLLFLISCLVLLLSYYYFIKRPRAIAFAHLEQAEWTLIYPQMKQRVHLNRVIDHQFYIAIYFDELSSPIVVWCDQLSFLEWKSLKVLAQFH